MVDAARPAPDAVIALVRGWAASDPARRGVRDAVVLGSVRSWWRRLMWRVVLQWR
ncbi:hypothetical protein [Actinomadura sediminis]|uniref:Uncharacterized protein n=1 Tax=Actinomadura sediminis TaxID=1038904 RepID=A0ABW3ESU7_9ACTN